MSAEPADDPGDLDLDDEIITCWCGVSGTYDELFDDEPFDGHGCGGSGTLTCHCGGDQCVCHHHGELECPGCEDCEEDRLDDDDFCDDEEEDGWDFGDGWDCHQEDDED